MKLQNILLIIGAVAFAALFFLFGKSCNDPAITNPAVDSTTYKRSLAVTDSLKGRTHDLERALNRSDSTIADYMVSSFKQKKWLDESEARADRYARMYKEARDHMDTPMVVSNCDSLAHEYESYKASVEEYIATTDSVVSDLYTENENNKAIVKDQLMYTEKLDSMLAIALKEKREVATDYAKMRRSRNNWRNTAVASLAAILARFFIK